MSKKQLLIMAATASVVIATAAGLYYWDAMAVGLLAALLWAKKLLTLKALLVLLKKLPFLLLLGLKRLIIKVTSHFLLFTAHLRFRRLQRMLRYLRVRAWLVKRRLKYHWQELSGAEQVLATVAALPLVVILSVLTVVFVLPRTLFGFLGSKLKEHSSAAVLKKAAQFGVRDKLVVAEQKIKEGIRRKLQHRISRGGNDKAGTGGQKGPPPDS
ncbi:hypothetical protein [Thiolapillus brandeum]|uniref:hypothetical protein n=1 Tax=Thiolapillus brandeum TaxID=1076588 RepID=UPI0005970FE2|nr:hypothetical protein [Thiolapillus brandeum]